MHVPCHGSLDYSMFGTFLDDDSVLADLFLNQDYLFSSIDHKVTAGIQWTLLKPPHVVVGFFRQDAPRTS